VIYAILGGFPQQCSDQRAPAGLPNPWIWRRTEAALTRATFWNAAGNSLVIALTTTLA
jgi:raffinose/stachyose/melibiose transport system permease protein